MTAQPPPPPCRRRGRHAGGFGRGGQCGDKGRWRALGWAPTRVKSRGWLTCLHRPCPYKVEASGLDDSNMRLLRVVFGGVMLWQVEEGIRWEDGSDDPIF